MDTPAQDNRSFGAGGWAAVAIAALVFFSSVRHIYRFGPAAMWLNVLTVVVVALAIYYRRKARGWSLWALLLLACWPLVGFGVVDGLWETLRVFGAFLLPQAQVFGRVPPGSFGFRAMGLLAGAAGILAIALGAHWLRAAARDGHARISRAHLVVSAAIVTAISLAAILKSGGAFGDSDEIPIGVIVPLQGPSAEMTQPFLQAVKLAVAERSGSRRYRLVVADSGPNGRDAKRAVERLLYEERVAAIVGGISLSGLVVQPYAAREKVLHICVCSVKTIGDGHYNFTNIPLPEDEAATWVREARARGIKTVAAITQDYPSIQGHMNALAREIAKSDLRLVFAEEFGADTRNFTSIVEAAAASRPDVYMIEGFNPSLDALMKELGRRDIHSIASIVALSLSAQAASLEGAWYTDSYLDHAFRARFTRSAPDTKLITHMVPYAYDSTNIVIDAIESGMNPPEYVRRLTTYQGAAGTLRLEASGGSLRSEPAVWEFRRGIPNMLDGR